MARLITFKHLDQAVNLINFDYVMAQERMSPVPRGFPPKDTPPKQAGVLVLVYPEPDSLHLVLTLRHAGLRGHSGQVSFPGGRQDPTDTSFTHTALRETCEELGICNDEITVVGMLSKFYIPPSHYDVYPTVGTMDTAPHFTPNPAEVEAVFSFSLESLLNPRYKFEEYREIQGYRVKIPYYDVQGHRVWGATAIMLSELEERLRIVVPDDIITEIESHNSP